MAIFTKNVSNKPSGFISNKEPIWSVFGTLQDKIRIKRWADASKLLQYFDSI